jgi:hypothetical protein
MILPRLLGVFYFRIFCELVHDVHRLLDRLSLVGDYRDLLERHGALLVAASAYAVDGRERDALDWGGV